MKQRDENMDGDIFQHHSARRRLARSLKEGRPQEVCSYLGSGNISGRRLESTKEGTGQ